MLDKADLPGRSGLEAECMSPPSERFRRARRNGPLARESSNFERVTICNEGCSWPLTEAPFNTTPYGRGSLFSGIIPCPRKPLPRCPPFLPNSTTGVGFHSVFDGIGRVWIAKFDPPSFCCREAVLRLLRDHVPFLFSGLGRESPDNLTRFAPLNPAKWPKTSILRNMLGCMVLRMSCFGGSWAGVPVLECSGVDWLPNAPKGLLSPALRRRRESAAQVAVVISNCARRYPALSFRLAKIGG
jgi:hypothetical protein